MPKRIGYAAAVAMCAVCSVARAGVAVRVATFNIQDFSSVSGAQFEAARDILIRIGADVVCVQEIDAVTHLNALAAAGGYPYSVLAHDANTFDPVHHAGVLSKYPFAMTAVETSITLSGDGNAKDIVRNFIVAAVDIPGAEEDLVIIGNHWKSGTTDADEFRRSVESIRAMQVTGSHDSSAIPYFVVGDMNDDINDSPDSPSAFFSLPGGLPVTFSLGGDISFPVDNGVFKALQAGTGPQHVTVIDAYQLAGSPLDATRPDSGRRLDYLWRSDAVTVVGSEVYDSNDDCAGCGLPKYGSPLPAGTSAAASDHLLVFADVTIEDGVGACCVDQECLEVTEAQCVSQSGVFHGLEVDCGEEVPACAAGACCLFGYCDDTLDAARCAAQGGDFRGVGVACGEEYPPCGLGVCCLDGICDDTLTESQCSGLGGSFRGAGLLCGEEEPSCSSGACCLDGGGCDDTLIESDCLAASGEFRGVGVLCGQEDPPCPGLPSDMVINEVMIAHEGIQDKEFVEIYGRPNVSLAGLKILAIEGEDSSKGRVDLVVSLDDCGGSPCTLDTNGYFVAGNSGVIPDLELYPGGTYLLEDGTQTIVLVRDCTVGYGADIDSDNDGVEDVSVGIVLDAVGLVDNDYPTGDAVYYSAPAIGPAPGGIPNGIPPGAGRCPNGVDTHGVNDWVLLSWVTDGSDGKAPITPHDPNPGCGGDYDGDADVDLYDFHCFQQCFDPGVTALPQCYAGEFDGDGDVDLNDFPLFINALGGP